MKKLTSLFVFLPVVLIGATTAHVAQGYYYEYPSDNAEGYYQPYYPPSYSQAYYGRSDNYRSYYDGNSYQKGYRHRYRHHAYNQYSRKKHGKYRVAAGESTRGVGGLPGKIAAPGQKEFIFSPRLRAWAAYDPSGIKVSGGTANGGNDYCPDIHRRCHTPVGAFRVLSKGSAGCISTRYPIKHIHGRTIVGGAHMPYCMYFTSNFAIHGYHVLTNRNVSHGCIRISTPSAQWLSSSFLNVGTRVRVLPY